MAALDWVQAIGTIATTVGLATAGAWAYLKYRQRRENQPRVIPDTSVEVIGRAGGRLLVMLKLEVKNSGLVRWTAENFTFELRYALPGEDLADDPDIGVLLPNVIEGSWIKRGEAMALDSGQSADWKYFARPPEEACLLQLLSKGEAGEAHFEDKVMVVPPPH